MRTAAVILLGLVLIVAGVAYYESITATGTLAIQIRDSPVAWSHVVVQFASVSVRPFGAANDTGWTPLTLQVDRLDLLAPGNVTQLLTLDRFAPGTFVEIRIVVLSVSGVLLSGTAEGMSVSNGVLQTPVAFTVRGGATTTVTFDLNLTDSIQPSGAGWVFAPVLRSVDVG